MLLQEYKHKNIVKFLGVAAIRDPMMIVMELVERNEEKFFSSKVFSSNFLFRRKLKRLFKEKWR